MQSKNSINIKKSFESFSKSRNFFYCESDPLIAPEKSKLLFNISGGVKYQNELLGLKVAKKDRISSIQKCVRTDGMKSIGYSGRHHLFFEMLGHFMFYCSNEKECKEEFIKFAYNFLIKEIELNKEKIFVTVHPDDYVTINTWKNLGVKNIIINNNNYFVSPYAEKSALRTEIKWQNPNETLVELWNLVFTQFNSKNIFENPSNLIASDSGASLERIVSAYENKNNNYDNSMWINYVNYISSLTLKGNINIYRRIADFFNTAAMLINDGIIPGNKTQSYTLRKILRTLFDICDELDISYEMLIDNYLNHNTLTINKEELYNILKNEYEKYCKTIELGMIQAQKLINKKGIENINSEYFRSTCGLPTKYIDLLISNNKQITLKRDI